MAGIVRGSCSSRPPPQSLTSPAEPLLAVHTHVPVHAWQCHLPVPPDPALWGRCRPAGWAGAVDRHLVPFAAKQGEKKGAYLIVPETLYDMY